MSANFFYLCSIVASLPYLAIVAVLVHYFLRRTKWRADKRRGKKNPGFCPSTSALGMMLLFMQVFVRPTLRHVLEERQNEDAEEDDQGDPEGITKQLHRQLKRIRRGRAGWGSCIAAVNLTGRNDTILTRSNRPLRITLCIYTRKRRSLCFSIKF
jgi:hypothetical protein